MLTKLIRLGTVATALMLGSYAVTASAAPVTNWSYTLDSGFTSFAPVGVTGSANNVLLGAPSMLSWGTPTDSGQSSLSVGSATLGHLSGNLVTDAPAINTVQVIHTNNPITGTSLSSATLTDRLALTATSPAGGTLALPDLLFQIRFLETPNQTPCTVSSPTPCNDIFVIDVAAAGFNPVDNSLNQNFSFAGDNYNAKIFLTGLGVLSNAACGVVGASNGCIGFTTVENQMNTFQASLQISSTQFHVPEPNVLALLAIGLLGFGVSKGRRPQSL